VKRSVEGAGLRGMDGIRSRGSRGRVLYLAFLLSMHGLAVRCSSRQSARRSTPKRKGSENGWRGGRDGRDGWGRMRCVCEGQ
jgi:hypothetical protein